MTRLPGGPITRDRARGTQKDHYPLDPAMMARSCRKLARDMRAEAALGYPPISLRSFHGEVRRYISRADAAASMDKQAERWEREASGGERNTEDRDKLGMY
jgi:hypothetical protein